MENSHEETSGPIRIHYRETNEEIEMNTHFHNTYEIIYVVEGTARFTINNRVYEVQPNSMAFINNLESHELKVTSLPYKRYFIFIRQEYFQAVVNEPVLMSILKHRPAHFRHVIHLTLGEYNILDLIKRMKAEIENKGEFWEGAISSTLYLLFISLYREYKEYFPLGSLNRSMEIILEIQKHIEQNCTEDISLEETAKMFYINMHYLSHLFKKMTGFTFKEYLVLQRLSRAKDLLFHSSDDITQVALRVGFNNVNHFIRIFKKFEGTTPYQYRKKFRA